MINLLPLSEKEKIYSGLFKKQAHTFGLTITVILVGGAILILNTFAFLKIQIRELGQVLRAEVTAAETQDAQAIEDSVKNLNVQLSQYKNFRAESVSPTLIFSKMEELIPAGAKLTALLVNAADYKIILAGRADNREDVILLESRLKKSDFFEKVDSPLSNLLEKTNSSFSFTFYFRK
ncbi:MAG: hypothetical protein HY452_02680 [Parcubacteria group bacterium]|nr:hypothetical protein [Parcubacteria group bacterium]